MFNERELRDAAKKLFCAVIEFKKTANNVIDTYQLWDNDAKSRRYGNRIRNRANEMHTLAVRVQLDAGFFASFISKRVDELQPRPIRMMGTGPSVREVPSGLLTGKPHKEALEKDKSLLYLKFDPHHPNKLQ